MSSGGTRGRIGRRASLALALVLSSGCAATPAPDDSAIARDGSVTDAASMTDAASATDAAVVEDAPRTDAATICPAYDAHARDCFGNATGEDFLAECHALYATCGGVLPTLVRCRLETTCAALGSCIGMGC